MTALQSMPTSALIVFSGTVRFQLPHAKIKLTTSPSVELVLEIDSRLIAKGDFDKLKEAPLASFKSLVQQIAPQIDTSFVLYGYRTAAHPGASKQDFQMQCVLKAPALSRKALIESSGATELLARDYMEKGKGSEDTTVLRAFGTQCCRSFKRCASRSMAHPGLLGSYDP